MSVDVVCSQTVHHVGSELFGQILRVYLTMKSRFFAVGKKSVKGRWFRVLLTGTRSRWSSRGSPPTIRERVSDRELKGSSVDNPQVKGVNERRNRVVGNECVQRGDGKIRREEKWRILDPLRKGLSRGLCSPEKVWGTWTMGGGSWYTRVPGTFNAGLSRVVLMLFAPCMVQYQVYKQTALQWYVEIHLGNQAPAQLNQGTEADQFPIVVRHGS